RFERRDAHRSFLARLEQPGNQLLAFEALPRPILLHHHVRDLVDPLVAGEALRTVQTLAAPPDDLSFLALARVDDFVAEVTTVRTLHAVFPCSACLARRSMPARFNPSWAAKKRPSISDGPCDNTCATIAAPTAAS